MELNDTTKIAIQFNSMARKKMGEKVDRFCIFNVNDNVNNREFCVEFEAYNYFIIRLNYQNGRFGCNIVSGDKLIALENSQKWWDNADFDVFFTELQQELEVRIPDKFLNAHGWI